MADTDPLETLNEAIATFVNATTEQAVLVNQAVVIWETVRFDEDGDAERAISYANTTDNFSLSGCLGMLEAGREFIRRDILDEGCACDG